MKKEDYTVFSDLYVPKTDGTTSQIDHVLVSRFGIFVIETKNYSGWIFGNETSSQWTQVLYRRKHRFLNPIIQNKGHVKALAEYLGIEDKNTFISMVVFLAKATFKDIKASTEVLYSLQLPGAIKRYSEESLNQEQLADTIIKLNQLKAERKLPGNKRVQEQQHIQQVKAQIEKSQTTCPWCGLPLVEKKGKYGAFLGCSGYPKCKFVKK